MDETGLILVKGRNSASGKSKVETGRIFENVLIVARLKEIIEERTKKFVVIWK